MRLLLVEDDLPLGSALSKSLTQAGFATTWVRRLAEARGFAREPELDAVLLDINLPDGEGFTLLTELRAANVRVPVLVMTAREQLDDRLRGLNSGADDYLVKPFAVAELIARTHAVIRRAAGFATPVWQVGPLAIDTAQRRVATQTGAIDLTPREYQLLVELARCAGRVVPKETLLARVWGANEDPSESSLEFYIHSLRKKLPADLIQTVRGVGYLLQATR